MAQQSNKWKVVVPTEIVDWQTAASGTEWIEAPDDIFPGYKSKRYDSELQALQAARQLRSTLMPGKVATFFDAATVPADA
jgi:hypothetical protein